jgi:ribosomal protein S18 acetylase RimI-like enzyme
MIRPPRAHERDALARLVERIDQFNQEERAVAMELIDEALTRADTTYKLLVAEGPHPPPLSRCAGEGSSILGYLCYGATPMTDTTADLYWIATDPSARGTGLGKALHAALVDVLRAEGRVWIRVETSSQDDYNGTVAFYTRLGYQTVSRIKDFYRAGDDLITMFYRV